ncbi:MAG: hypothetical protein WD055_01405 [Candidatus Dependentiae bacterium]
MKEILTIIFIWLNPITIYAAAQVFPIIPDSQLTIEHFIFKVGIKPEKILESQIATYQDLNELPTIIKNTQAYITKATTAIFTQLPKNDTEFEQSLHLFIVTQALNRILLQGFRPESALFEMRQQDTYKRYIELHKTKGSSDKITTLAIWLKAFKKKQKNKEIPHNKKELIKAIDQKFRPLNQQIESNPKAIKKLIEEKRKKFISSLNSGQMALNSLSKNFELSEQPMVSFFERQKAQLTEQCILQ